MWMEKISAGVLRVLTPIGPRYIQPSLLERVYLLWIFRHFQILPQQVLTSRQQKLIDALCTSHHFVSLPYAHGMEDAPILGTVERRPVVEAGVMPPRRPAASVSETSAVGPLVANARQRS